MFWIRDNSPQLDFSRTFIPNRKVKVPKKWIVLISVLVDSCDPKIPEFQTKKQTGIIKTKALNACSNL